MKNLIVGQSGGPTAVINSSLYGVIREGFNRSEEIEHVYGMINGIQGFLDGRFMDMKELDNDTLEALRTTPGAYLGSCRFKLPDDLNDAIYPLLFQKFEEMNIGYFFYIGGNDSMDTVSKLSRYAAAHNIDVRIMGIPKTIDNDLILTDHTPGFGSAAKYVAASVCEIGLDASVYNTKSVTIIEIMGRHAGWLTAASVLARKFELDNPVLIYLPEADFDQESFLASLEECFKTKNNLIVCVSEGIHDKDGTFICEYAASAGVDAFGHKMLTGCGKYLENLVRDRLGVKVRSVELNVNQRCSAFLQSETDALEAAQEQTVTLMISIFSQDEAVIFKITDDGPGIPVEYKDEIFNTGFSTKINFETGEVSRGIGLGLVKDLVEKRLGGSIELASVPGNITFTVSIPKNQIEVIKS